MFLSMTWCDATTSGLLETRHDDVISGLEYYILFISGQYVLNIFLISVPLLCNKALWLVKTSHMTCSN